MTDTKDITRQLYSAGNNSAMEFAKRLGVPLQAAQKLMLSKAWKQWQKEHIAAKVAQIKKADR